MQRDRDSQRQSETEIERVHKSAPIRVLDRKKIKESMRMEDIRVILTSHDSKSIHNIQN